jgi:hypothetical protein
MVHRDCGHVWTGRAHVLCNCGLRYILHELLSRGRHEGVRSARYNARSSARLIRMGASEPHIRGGFVYGGVPSGAGAMRAVGGREKLELLYPGLDSAA